MRKGVGRYRITGKLGEGGMGVVYVAEDETLGRRVALKMLKEATEDAVAGERLRREARAAAGVSHPHVCQVFEVGEEGGEVYLAMEFLEGEPLSSRIDRGPLAPQEVVRVGIEILEGLGALHARGFLHRDLKPSNVFLTPHGVKLLDFGLAFPLSPLATDTGERLTGTGMLVGTPGFMAPEQWEGEEIGAPCDIFAVGALLFEMLTGEPAFTGSGPLAVYHAIVHQQPPAITGGPLVQAVDRVVQRALAKDPAARYGTTSEMAADLGAAARLEPEGTAARARTVTRLITLPFHVMRPDPDTEFLGHGLPDAVAGSLARIDSIVVRLQQGRTDTPPEGVDASAAARAANVEFALTGSLLRSGDRLRVTAQLVRAADGAVQWSESVDARVGDLFELQDELTRKIVGSLAIPLTAGAKRGLAKERPASPEAFECYLRANRLSLSPGTLTMARDLYLECLRHDPAYASAWARLGRAYRVMAKYGYGDAEEDDRRAAEAFRKALELDPDLPIAHHLFTHFEIEKLAAAPRATVRLIEQASRHPSDPELFTGLIVTCRFCGLLDASLAADRRARRLDPGIRTSVAYTHLMRGEYELALRQDDEDMRFVTLDALPMLGREDEAIALCEELERDLRRTPLERSFSASKRTALQGDREACEANALRFRTSSFRDPEGFFHLARDLAHVGALDLAMELMQDVVARGFHCPDAFMTDPWLAPLRTRPGWDSIVDRARAGHEAALREFRAAGGDGLLVL